MISDQDKLDCAERELHIRRHVYSQWVRSGLTTQAKADREIAVMEAIAQDYRDRIGLQQRNARHALRDGA